MKIRRRAVGRAAIKGGALAVITVVGALGHFLYTEGALTKPWWAVAALFYVSVVLTVSILYESYRGEKRAKERARQDIRAQTDIAETSRRYALLDSASEGLVDVMRDVLSALHTGRHDLAPGERGAPGGGLFGRVDKATLVRRLMARLCDNVFKADPYPHSYGESLHPYFKCTLYEPDSQPGQKIVLRRTNSYYPPAMHPSRDSQAIREATHPRATAILVFKNEQIEVIEDVQEEVKKPANVKRWMPLYDGQEVNYRSMFSYPIIRGIPRADDRQIVGVLTIDTNRARYFREDNESKVFLTQIVHPYAILIATLYELEKLFEARNVPRRA